MRRARLRATAIGIALLAVTLALPARAWALTLPASCTSFTDNPLAADSMVIKAVHITQLRTCIADLRTATGLSAVTWTDPTITAGVTVVKAVHVTEMRTALAAVFTAAGVTPPTYSHTPAAGGTIFAADLNEMRSAIPSLAGTPTCASPPSGLTPTGASWESSGGQGTTTLGYPAGCSYAVTSNAAWLAITSASTATVTYQVAMNSTLAVRTGTLTIAGLTFTVTQAAAAEVVTYIDSDAVGSVRMTTDAAGQVLARYDYLPFGTLWSAPSTTEKRLFGGKERDQETSFDYFGGRYYANANGRFTTPDPAPDIQNALVNPQTWGRYAYVSNNPLRKIDPNGRYEIDVHLYLTVALARAAGIDGALADRIGASDQGVDDSPSTGPFVDRAARRDFHFTETNRRTQLWETFEKGGSPEQLGVFLHAEQDSFSHEGFGPTFGHLSAGHAPDQTFSAPVKADAMAHDTYDRLRAAIPSLGKTSRTALPWEKVSPYILRFNRATDLEEKRRILEELMRVADSKQ